MIDTEIWSHWKGFAETIKLFQNLRLYEKTKDVRATEYRDCLDSLYNISPKV
jgi:hypothetical protein